jgi:hypothetical protein
VRRAEALELRKQARFSESAAMWRKAMNFYTAKLREPYEAVRFSGPFRLSALPFRLKWRCVCARRLQV